MTGRKRTFSVMLTSAVMLGSSIVGCSGAGTQQRPSASVSRPQILAPQIEKALAGKRYDRALAQAEQLVAALPDDAGHRSLLGRAYLANGRFSSARAAFQDAMTLGSRDVRTIVSLALAQIGLGDAQAAQALLVDQVSALPAADYGLAMAMAGNAEEGVRALVEAARQPEATMQTRQNLAYALALGGAWAQARLIAGQDLSARDAEQRIGEWSRSGTAQQRVIAMLGVVPRGDDAGMPVELALRSETEEPQLAVQVAPTADLIAQARTETEMQPQIAAVVSVEAADSVIANMVETAPEVMFEAHSVEQAQSRATPDIATLAAILADEMPAPALQRRGTNDPMREAAQAAFQRNSGQTPPATNLVVRSRPAASATSTAQPVINSPEMSDWVIQLGAFDSAAVAREKWRQISKRQSAIDGFAEVLSEVTVNGRLFHRLAIRGFGDRNMASVTCRSLKAAGQACFVRLDDRVDSHMAREPAHRSG